MSGTFLVVISMYIYAIELRITTVSGTFPVIISMYIYAIELRITTVSVCHVCSAHLCLRVSSYTSGLVSVLPSQKIKLYIDDPTHINYDQPTPE